MFVLPLAGARNERPEVVSMIQLIANPDKYHGKTVGINGYLRNVFEHSSIYYTKELSDRRSTKDALWVRYHKDCKMNPHTEDGLEYFDKKWVLLVGQFRKDEFGHMGANSGAIVNVTIISTNGPPTRRQGHRQDVTTRLSTPA